jgi:hypothetical protein
VPGGGKVDLTTGRVRIRAAAAAEIWSAHDPYIPPGGIHVNR